MKQLIFITVNLIASLSFAATKNEGAYDLEQAYLNVAKVLSDSHLKDGPCGEVEAYTMEIVDTTRKARNYFDSNWEWNKETGRKFKIDPAVTKVLADTLALKDIMNMLDYNNPATFEHALNRVVMWGPAPGAYGNMSYIKFGSQNKVEIGQLEHLNSEPWYQWNITEGTFSVQKVDWNMIVVIEVEGQTQSYKLNNYNFENYIYNMWYMVPAEEPDSNPYFNGFVDYPSECEA